MNYNKSNVSTSSKNNRSTCKNCNQPINRGAPICYHCGELQESYNLSPEAQARLQKKIRELIHEYNATEIDIATLFDKSAQRYANACARLQTMLNNELIQDSDLEGIMERLNRVDTLCKSREYSIAFIGNIKAGKSSLINEILSFDLASVDTIPETASLTKFRSSKDGLKLSLEFYTADEWNEIWDEANKANSLFIKNYRELEAEACKKKCLNSPPKTFSFSSIDELKEELSKWTSAKSSWHFFVKEVEVQLVNDLLNIPSDVVLVDTPGLDDVIPYRSNITRKYIKKANAIIVCIKGEALGVPQHRLIAEVIANTEPENVFVLCTQIDNFNKPIEEFEKHKKLWLNYLKEGGFFGDENLAKKRLFGISSYIPMNFRKYDNGDLNDSFRKLKSLASKFNILTEEQEDMGRKEIEPLFAKDSAIRQKLQEYSGIKSLWKSLYNEIIQQHQSQFRRELTNTWGKLAKAIDSVLSSVMRNSEEIVSANKFDIQHKVELRERLKEQKEDLENNIQEYDFDNFQKELDASYKEMKKLLEGNA